MKQCTYSVREMLKDLENDYQKYISMNRGESYVFAVLWEDFYDSDPNEEMIICNLIIANMNLKASHVVIKGYYDEENLILVDEIAREWGVISMTYLHKASFENGIMRYEYGIVKGVYIGAIEFRADVATDASDETRDFKLIFYDDNSFNGVTRATA